MAREILDPPLITSELPPQEVIFGSTPAMQIVRQTVAKAAGANIPVLIRGESGTGKELIATLLHGLSPWAAGPFVRVNCPAIPGTLVESELFGFEKGAFTGAMLSKPGRVEMADGGTLFLDEIGDLDPMLQAKLLRLLQDGQFNRIGSHQDRQLNVRVVCATNRHLEEEMAAGGFRRDLFYRINAVTVALVPLRERSDDIPCLVEYFLMHYSRKYGRRPMPLSSVLMSELRRHSWPGNVRQLENLIKRYVILDSEEVIISELLQANDDLGLPVPNGACSLKDVTREAVAKIERKFILRALQASNWNRRQAAGALKISYRSLLYKIKEAGIPPHRTPSAARMKEEA
ncbi:MAG TPA: sigma 54-interacting transcriptional regulator [Terriglobales bacterium]|nr:sigma 54-interacting transcriptional regulator [Terriglobales bacterium]